MPFPTDTEKEWIYWCHSDQPAMYAIAALEAVKRMVDASPYPHPVVLAETQDGDSIARGYAVACQGAIGYLGRLHCQPAHNDEPSLLARTVADLCRKTLTSGVELVQAILPADADGPVESGLRKAFQSAGMIRAARLLQFECTDIPFRHDGSPMALSFSPIELRSYRDMPWYQWCQLVEETYTDTLDVPILNGIRSIEQTLRGYAVGQPENELAWWSIHAGDSPIGCLILTSLSNRDCELTYLGLVPAARGHRYSPEIMDYVGQWMLDQGKSRIVLAVDEKNAPALHLYDSFGFEPMNAVEAWIASPRHGD
jgi:GNAT superfamily N-acetyltransferase